MSETTQLCTCGHDMIAHNLAWSKRSRSMVRTWCTHGDAGGTCGCKRFQAKEGGG